MRDVAPDVALAHHVAALRELFEEAGILLASPLDAMSIPQLEQYRRDLLAALSPFPKSSAANVSASGI
jgi:8-oxo-dGTP pyrophosphatase MutT (NUDIX family)